MGRQSLPKAGKLKNGSNSMQFRNRVEQKTMIKLLKSTTSGIWKARMGNVQRAGIYHKSLDSLVPFKLCTCNMTL